MAGMPVRYVSEQAVRLYTDSVGDEVVQVLSLGDRIDLDGFEPRKNGRALARHGSVSGWIDTDKISDSAMGLIASARRSGASIPEPSGSLPSAAETERDFESVPQMPPARTSTRPQAPLPVRPSARLERLPDPPIIRTSTIVLLLVWLLVAVPLYTVIGWPALILALLIALALRALMPKLQEPAQRLMRATAESIAEDPLPGHSADDELAEQAVVMQKPVTMEDDFFGTLTLDRRIDTFETDAKWGSSVATLSVEGPAEEVASSLQCARQLWAAQPDFHARIVACAVEHLLALKNDTWLDEDEEELTPKQFTERMRIQTISVDPSGAFEFWFDDGDLFYGHSIMVSGDLAAGPTDADIHG